MTSRRALKIVVALAVVAGLVFAFVRSARQSRAEPYKVSRAALGGWRVSIEAPTTPSSPVLALRGSSALTRDLFKQIFARMMESFVSPAMDGIVLVSRAELEGAFEGRADVRALAAVASEVGLDTGELVPRCLGYRRVSSVGGTRQLYFLVFEAPAFVRFRERIAAMATPGTFDPAALSPVAAIAASEGAFEGWGPLRADPATDCVASITIE